MTKRLLDNGGLVLAIMLAVAMSATDFFIGSSHRLEGELGICMPSPNLWVIPQIASWAVNLTLILGIGIVLHFFNKTYNFVSSTDTVLSAAFIVLCSSNAWINGTINSSVIMAAAQLLCLAPLFNSYRSSNASQQLFLVGTVLSLGSMFQYAFIFFIPAYLLIALTLKCLDFRGFIAMLMGIIAPYWVGVGLGLITPESFRLPTLTNLFWGFDSRQALITGMLNCAVTFLIFLLFFLSNAVRLYAGNTRRRLMNNAISVLGFVAMICAVFDFDNLSVYMGTLYLATALQIANFFALHNIRYGRTWVFIITMIYVASFVLMENGLKAVY